MTLELVRAPDILASVAKLRNGPFTVGFAAETDHLREHALAKLASKQLDMIVANKVGAEEGFDRDDNAVEVFWNGGEKSFALAAKTEIAAQLVDLIASHYTERSGTRNNVSAIAASD